MNFPSLKAVVAIACLSTAMLLLDFGLIFYVEKRLPGSQWVGLCATAAIFIQPLLIGFWLALGDGRCYWRTLVAIPAGLAIAATFPLAATLSSRSRPSYADDWPMTCFFMIFLTLAMCVLVLPLRRLRKWRLTWNPIDETEAVSLNYQIGDILFWMVPIGALLAMMRFIGSLNDTDDEGLREAVLPVAGIAILTFAAALAAFARRRALAVVVLLSLAVGLGCLLAAPDIYRQIEGTRAAVRGPVAWQVYVSTSSPILKDYGTLTTASAAFAWLSYSIMRAFGCRLIRPGTAAVSAR